VILVSTNVSTPKGVMHIDPRSFLHDVAVKSRQ